MIKKQKVIILKGIIDSLDAFAEELFRGFEEAGCDCLMINVNDLRYFQDEAFVKIEEYTQDKSAFVVFMNNIGMMMKGQSGGNYWNQSGVRCFDILADPPFFYDRAICSDIENVTFICVDQDQSDYINRYYQEGSLYHKTTGRTRFSCFMPLAGMRLGQAQLSNDNRPWNQRSMDVVFTGNLRNYRNIDSEIANLPESLHHLWDIVYERVNRDTDLTIEKALRKCMNDFELELNDNQVLQVLLLFKRMDSILRARYREKIVSTLVAHGVYVHVFGDGWQYLKNEYPQTLIIHERVSYKQSVLLMQDTKISLNVMPWFKRGFHDRIATAALNGCVSITDRSAYTQTNYIDGQDIIYYDLKELEELPDKVKYLLDHEKEAEQIAQNAYNIALAKDTWKQRAEWLLNVNLTKGENR